MKWTFVAVALLVVLLGVSILPGQTKPLEQMSDAEIKALMEQQNREVLRDLPGVYPHIMWFGHGPSQDEEKQRLRIAVELRLRNSGIHLLGSPEFEKHPGKPILVCTISYYTIGSALVARPYVGLLEDVVLVRTSKVSNTETWTNSIPGQKLVNDRVSFEQGREWLLEAVDEFCNAYRAMNPKTVP